jgi:hypothetical protein
MVDSMIPAPLLILTIAYEGVVRYYQLCSISLQLGHTIQKRQMISFFCGKFPTFQIGHHAFCPSVNMNESILDRSHSRDRQDLLSASEFVRVEQLE